MNKYINRIILAFTVVSFALVASSCGGGNRAEDTTKDPWGWNKGDEDKKTRIQARKARHIILRKRKFQDNVLQYRLLWKVHHISD